MTALTIAPWGYVVAGAWLLLVAVIVVGLCLPAHVRDVAREQARDDRNDPEPPPDPAQADLVEPVDVDACDHCSGTGGIWPSDDPQDVYACPVCYGEGILPEYQVAS